MGTNGPKRTKDEKLRDRARVAELYLSGRTQAEIGEELGFTQQQISYDLKKLREDWLTSSRRNFDEAKAQELAKIDQLERTYWEAWNRSFGEHTVTTERERSGTESSMSESSTRTEDIHGDPRFLAGIERCIERRCKLLGLDAPQKNELTGAGGGPIKTEGNVIFYMPDNGRDNN